jgi:2-aminoadipate transaminase
VADLIRRHDVLLVEDDPYSALRYRGDPLPSLKSLAPEQVVYLGTLSKVLAPGLRVGYCVAPQSLRKWLVIAKQGIDLHTGSLSQALAAEYLSGGHLRNHLPTIISLYRPRQEAMLEALERFFPPGFRWSRPGRHVHLGGGAAGPPLRRGAISCRAGQGIETLRLNYMADERAWPAIAIPRGPGLLQPL